MLPSGANFHYPSFAVLVDRVAFYRFYVFHIVCKVLPYRGDFTDYIYLSFDVEESTVRFSQSDAHYIHTVQTEYLPRFGFVVLRRKHSILVRVTEPAVLGPSPGVDLAIKVEQGAMVVATTQSLHQKLGAQSHDQRKLVLRANLLSTYRVQIFIYHYQSLVLAAAYFPNCDGFVVFGPEFVLGRNNRFSTKSLELTNRVLVHQSLSVVVAETHYQLVCVSVLEHPLYRYLLSLLADEFLLQKINSKLSVAGAAPAENLPLVV